MKKPDSVRDYHLSDAELKQNCDLTAKSIFRDMVKFATRGVTAATTTSLTNLSALFGDLPTDEELKADQAQSTLEKDTAAENLRVAIRSLRTMASNKYGQGAPKYDKYGFEGMDKMTDNELYRSGKRSVRVATTDLSNLASEGLSTAFISNLNGLVAIFDNAIDAKDDAVNLRDIKAQERVESGNALYKELVRLSNIGKDLFASTDPARYNDYIIYDSPKSKPDSLPTTPPTSTTTNSEEIS